LASAVAGLMALTLRTEKPFMVPTTELLSDTESVPSLPTKSKLKTLSRKSTEFGSKQSLLRLHHSEIHKSH
jgi:hypothetical protein